MFRRGKDKGEGRANRLGKEAKPNTLSWVSEDAAEAGDDFEIDEEELDGEAFDEDEPLEADFSEDDEEVDETEAEIAKRQLELQAELDRQAEEFGLAGLDTAAVYGANGDLVLELLDRLEQIDVDDADRLADAWLAVDPADRDVVERDLRRRHREGKRRYELGAAEDAVATWLSNRVAAEPDDAELWRIVADAARGAVDALVLDEDLDDVDYETLYGAWAEVMDRDDDDDERGGKGGAKGGGKGGSKGAGKSGAKGGKSGAKGAADDPEKPEQFGPNSELVTRLIERIRDLTAEEALRLAASFREQPKSGLRQAHDAVRDVVAEDQAWRGQVKAAQDAVADILTAKVVRHATMRTDLIEKEQAARRAALPAAVDAATALVLADLLELEDAELLFGPWADTIGEPDLPEFEDD
jgi:hypothetical protein